MQKESSRIDGQRFSSFLFECVMAVLYVAVAVMLLFTSFFNESMSSGIRLPLGIVLGIYGLFRVYRALKKIIAKKEDSEEKMQ